MSPRARDSRLRRWTKHTSNREIALSLICCGAVLLVVAGMLWIWVI